MKNICLILFCILFLHQISFSQSNLKPTEDKVLVMFVVTDYNKIPEADADVFIRPDSGEVINARTGDDGMLKALISKGAKCSMTVKKFGKEFNFDDDLTIVGKEGLFALKHTLKIRLVTNYLRKYVLKGVNFDTNKNDLRDDAQKPIGKLLKVMKENGKMIIELAGHTDSDGEDKDNMLLSQRRSNAVKNFLVKNGIDKMRIIAKGYGETSPTSDNETPEGKQANRRTEVRVIEE